MGGAHARTVTPHEKEAGEMKRRTHAITEAAESDQRTHAWRASKSWEAMDDRVGAVGNRDARQGVLAVLQELL